MNQQFQILLELERKTSFSKGVLVGITISGVLFLFTLLVFFYFSP